MTMELLAERAGRPSDEEIRKALRNWAFVLPGVDDREAPDNVRNVLHWVAKASGRSRTSLNRKRPARCSTG
ncbi:hypothetical protein ACFY8B_16040 [Streptomyces sp. NPDC012751]|uniref:hypothetical protein n=1 Tax=Streptomyces sp. NPDC012751 TaxID=3364846 RepID=UPI0036A87448